MREREGERQADRERDKGMKKQKYEQVIKKLNDRKLKLLWVKNLGRTIK